MASGAGKAAQPPGPGSAVNGTAAELSGIEQELYDDQMHSKMCKKIAQLTKVRAAPPGGEQHTDRLSGLMGWFGDGCVPPLFLPYHSPTTHRDTNTQRENITPH